MCGRYLAGKLEQDIYLENYIWFKKNEIKLNWIELNWVNFCEWGNPKNNNSYLTTDVKPSVTPITGFRAAPIIPNPTPRKKPCTPLFFACQSC